MTGVGRGVGFEPLRLSKAAIAALSSLALVSAPASWAASRMVHGRLRALGVPIRQRLPHPRQDRRVEEAHSGSLTAALEQQCQLARRY